VYARMTFVLGHELVHMAEDDYWHFKTFMGFDGEPEICLFKYIKMNYNSIKRLLAFNCKPPVDFEQLGGVA